MTPSYSGRDTGARDILHGEVQLEEHGDCIFYQGSKHKVHNITPMNDATLQKLLADVCPTQFGRDKIDCSHAKCRRCCFYFCDNFHFPTNKKEEKTIAAVIYYKKLNILSALINIYLNFKISTSSSQTIPFQFLYFLSRPNCVGQTSAKSFWSVFY